MITSLHPHARDQTRPRVRVPNEFSRRRYPTKQAPPYTRNDRDRDRNLLRSNWLYLLCRPTPVSPLLGNSGRYPESPIRHRSPQDSRNAACHTALPRQMRDERNAPKSTRTRIALPGDGLEYRPLFSCILSPGARKKVDASPHIYRVEYHRDHRHRPSRAAHSGTPLIDYSPSRATEIRPVNKSMYGRIKDRRTPGRAPVQTSSQSSLAPNPTALPPHLLLLSVIRYLVTPPSFRTPFPTISTIRLTSIPLIDNAIPSQAVSSALLTALLPVMQTSGNTTLPTSHQAITAGWSTRTSWSPCPDCAKRAT